MSRAKQRAPSLFFPFSFRVPFALPKNELRPLFFFFSFSKNELRPLFFFPTPFPFSFVFPCFSVIQGSSIEILRIWPDATRERFALRGSVNSQENELHLDRPVSARAPESQYKTVIDISACVAELPHI
jgi:hypothetical protein